MADTHVYLNNTNAIDRLKGALSAYQNVGEIDFPAFGGDIILQTANAVGKTATEIPTGYYNYDVYDGVLDIIDDYFPTTEKLFTMGNHEFPSGGNDTVIAKEGIDLFEQYFNEGNLVKTVKDYTFIAARPDGYNNVMSAETENWVMEQADAAIAKNSTKPVFLLIHQPIDSTVVGSNGAGK